MSGKKIKEARKGVPKEELVRRRLEAQFAKNEVKAIHEGQKFIRGEEADPNVILNGLSHAERLMIKGHATPSMEMFKRLVAKGLVVMMKNPKTEKPQLVPTGMAFVIKDMMDGKLTVIKGEKLKHDNVVVDIKE